jgi:mycoredoxin
MTRRTLSHLDKLGVPYEYINVEQDREASEWVKQQNNGKEKKPTLAIAGTVLCTPANAELEEVLRRERILQ